MPARLLLGEQTLELPVRSGESNVTMQHVCTSLCVSHMPKLQQAALLTSLLKKAVCNTRLQAISSGLVLHSTSRTQVQQDEQLGP